MVDNHLDRARVVFLIGGGRPGAGRFMWGSVMKKITEIFFTQPPILSSAKAVILRRTAILFVSRSDVQTFDRIPEFFFARRKCPYKKTMMSPARPPFSHQQKISVFPVETLTEL